MFYEAHDVLEALWLKQRNGPNYSFYKGLIQFARRFVALAKPYVAPPASASVRRLVQIGQANLVKEPFSFRVLDVAGVLGLIENWLSRLEAGRFEVNPLSAETAPTFEVTGTVYVFGMSFSE